MPPLTGLRSFPLPINPASITQGFFAGIDRARQDEVLGLQLQEARAKAAQQNRPPQTLTLGAPAVPGVAIAPHGAPPGGGSLLSLEEAPQGISPGLPALTETLTEFPREETPLEFERRRRQAQANLDARQADNEAIARALAGDWKGFYGARVRAWGALAENGDESQRTARLKQRDEAMDDLAKVRLQTEEYDPEFARMTAAFAAHAKDPMNPPLWMTAFEIAVRVKGEQSQRLASKWIGDSLQEMQRARKETDQDAAVFKIELALTRKRVERRDKGITMDDAESDRMLMEVMQEFPREWQIYDRAMSTAKGKLPELYWRGAHQLTSKEGLLYQEAARQIIAEQGPDAPTADIEARYALLKRGETPSMQESKVGLQQAQAEAARAKAKASAELATTGKVTPLTLDQLTRSLQRFDSMLKGLGMSRYTDQERKEQETILKGEIADLHRQIKGIQAPTAAPAPTGYTPAGAALFLRMKALYDDDPDPRKGSWADPEVRKRYKNKAEQSPR